MCRGGGCIGSFMLNLRTGWRLVVDFTPSIFTPRKQSSYPLNVGWMGHRASLDFLEKGIYLSPTQI